eukprot:m.98793 g.98793  ORF g.98793 m.98793 type:complete len:426 (+) comp13647_c0_seq5:523-1800(+)
MCVLMMYLVAMFFSLPHSEFTIAKAAKKSKLGDYATIMLGKWHLGDLWNKTNLRGFAGQSNPSDAGFDEWMMTEAEASSSMSNCGCFPVDHAHPGPKPPSGPSGVTPHGDHCVVGGGFESDWCYPCTNYYSPNSSTRINVSALSEKIPGDDTLFIVGQFEKFLNARIADKRPFLAHLCTHSIHEPHPSMPEYYHQYQNDPDYLGTLTQLDTALGQLFQLLETNNMMDNIVIFQTSDNGPHQGEERSNILYSSQFLRQCKASIFEGGIRVPGWMYAPMLINEFKNVTTPATTADFLPTIMDLLGVESDHPDWVMDGISLLPIVTGNITQRRSKPLVFKWASSQAIIDNEWKLMNKPNAGQCDFQEPYSSMKKFDDFYLFNLDDDYHELNQLVTKEPAQYQRMLALYNNLTASINMSKYTETKCGLK